MTLGCGAGVGVLSAAKAFMERPVAAEIQEEGLLPGRPTNRLWLEPIENVELIELENAGHAAWTDRPEAFHDALIRGLERE